MRHGRFPFLQNVLSFGDLIVQGGNGFRSGSELLHTEPDFLGRFGKRLVLGLHGLQISIVGIKVQPIRRVGSKLADLFTLFLGRNLVDLLFFIHQSVLDQVAVTLYLVLCGFKLDTLSVLAVELFDLGLRLFEDLFRQRSNLANVIFGYHQSLLVGSLLLLFDDLGLLLLLFFLLLVDLSAVFGLGFLSLGSLLGLSFGVAGFGILLLLLGFRFLLFHLDFFFHSVGFLDSCLRLNELSESTLTQLKLQGNLGLSESLFFHFLGKFGNTTDLVSLQLGSSSFWKSFGLRIIQSTVDIRVVSESDGLLNSELSLGLENSGFLAPGFFAVLGLRLLQVFQSHLDREWVDVRQANSTDTECSRNVGAIESGSKRHTFI
mmetsp:Transcript_116878/g.337738  ORF Transcript_116878/g.337738 Transcript_116878/m.337738 type:complete len:375 (+) Transcript_116878:535-1659(+)